MVGWMIAEVEAAELAQQLIAETCAKQGVQRAQLTLHADNGSPMIAKSVAILLADLGVKTVVDLTPGSGSAARACMQLDSPYHGWAKNAEHASWLQNVLDRAALQVICEVGSPLHTDLAEAIKEHFSDVLDQMNEQDKGMDVTPDDGALDDA